MKPTEYFWDALGAGIFIFLFATAFGICLWLGK